uniref:Protein involved in heme biosynthesis n=1 Tax=Moramonas marocensis TaxID=1805496 RepID=A0A140F2H9_9EUKA|nr:protein involved in heme biosynthesis [Moramonas marocensis]
MRAFRTATIISAFVFIMIALSYAAVPLYRIFCQITGFGGTSQVGHLEWFENSSSSRNSIDFSDNQIDLKALENEINTLNKDEMDSHIQITPKKSRVITVHFNADVSDMMPWKFYPIQQDIKVMIGETSLAFYSAQNISDSAVVGISTYNVSPQEAGIYFNKIQCFCFEEQRLKPHESIDMPVFFFLDVDMMDDPKMSEINTITLSYTFFKLSDSDTSTQIS